MTSEQEVSRKGGRPRGDVRRRQILDAALELFAQRGFHTVGIGEIAQRVGITQAGLLHHYPSKAALLLAVLQEREARNQQDDAQARAEGADGLGAFLLTLEHNEHAPGLVQLFALLSAESITASHPAHVWFEERYERIVAQLTADLAEIVDVSALPEGADEETVARWVIGLADGLRIQWLLRPDAMNRHHTMQLFIDFLRPLLSAPSES